VTIKMAALSDYLAGKRAAELFRSAIWLFFLQMPIFAVITLIANIVGVAAMPLAVQIKMRLPAPAA